MNSQKPQRLAIIGCEAVGAHHLLPVLRRIGWLPEVLADPSENRLRAVAHKLGGKARSITMVADWEAALNQFDAAIVAGPHALHNRIGEELLRAGKHVFMEIPPATAAQACRDMVVVAAQRGLTLSIGLPRRHLHVARWTKALLAAGVLGEPRRFVAQEGCGILRDTTVASVPTTEPRHRGVLMSVGAHALDLLLWWFGPVTFLEYSDDNCGGVEANCFLKCRMTSGVEGIVGLGYSRDLRNSVRIEGARGFVEVHLSKNKVLDGSPRALAFLHDGFSAANMTLQPPTELVDMDLKDFRSSLRTGTRRGIPGPEAIHSLELIERCYAVRKPLELPWMAKSTVQKSRSEMGPRLSPGSTVLITGGSGFIGGSLVERLVGEHGARIRCVVRDLANCGRAARFPVEFVRADLTDRAAIQAAMQGVDYVFHCAYDVRSRRQNIEGTHNLLEAAAEERVNRFVHVSTFSVYEPFPVGELTEDTRDGDPSWVYARTKLDLERQVVDYVRRRGLSASIVQPSIVYGPFSQPWTNAPAEMLLNGGVILPDGGEGLCNAIYIDDLVDGLIRAACISEAAGERFIMSGPEPVRWATFFEAFAAALGCRPPIFWPASSISRANHGLMWDARLVLRNPKRIVQILVRSDPARRVLQGALENLPGSVKAFLDRHYFARNENRAGQPTLPSPQLLRLYSSQATVQSQKARRLLGFNPSRDFCTGMVLTASYLRWAYGDMRQALAGSKDGPNLTDRVSALDTEIVI